MNKLDELIQELCPDGVEYKSFGDCAKIVRGASPRPIKNFITTEPDGVNWIKIGDVKPGEKYITSSAEKITLDGAKKSRPVKKGDFILSNSMSFGRPYILKIDGCVHDGWLAISEFSDSYVSDFLYYLLSSNMCQNQMKKKASFGGAVQNLNADIVRELNLPVPPLEIQQEIVRLLDDFTAKIAELQAELNKEYEARKLQEQYYFKQIFSMYNAPIVKLGDIGRVKMCKRILKAQTSSQGEIPFFKIGTFGKSADAFISKELYEEYIQKYSYPSKGDILISCAGTIGRTVVYDGNPAYFQDSNIVWLEHDNSQITNEYLRYVYKTNPWEISTGGTISRLYNDGIINAQIHLPTIEQQCKIVNMLDNFEKLCEELQSNISTELESRQKQYEFYRDKLLTFKELNESEVN